MVVVVVVVMALVVVKAAALVVFNCALLMQTLLRCQIIFHIFYWLLTFYIDMHIGTSKDLVLLLVTKNEFAVVIYLQLTEALDLSVWGT